MSYLNRLRLVFSGRFQADPSTVNNDIRHFDSAQFMESFQEFQTTADANGWWNPDGTGAFRLIDCRVVAVHYADGTSTDDPTKDPIIGLSVLDANVRSGGKIVDLDPQCQTASQLWGFKVRLADTTSPVAVDYLNSNYAENPFRDLWFTRTADRHSDEAESAMFQSVLTDLQWGDTSKSRFLTDLRASTQDRELSIRLTTYGYLDNHTVQGFTTGIVSGIIGPAALDEPESIIVGRRFAPKNQGTGVSWNNITYFTGLLVETPNEADVNKGYLLLDLSNALPLATNETVLDIGELSLGIITDGASGEGDVAGPGNFMPIGTIPYRDAGWLAKTGGIIEFPLTRGQLRTQPAPFALATARPAGATPIIAISETSNGWFIGAEPFVLRMDTVTSGPAYSNFTLYVAQYGIPQPNTVVTITQQGPQEGNSGGSSAPLEGAHGVIPIPVSGIPMEALSVPATLTTNGRGTAAVTVAATNPNNPRGYIDGQLYVLNYAVQGENPSNLGQFEVVSIHVRDPYPVPAKPTWVKNIRAIFDQYGNLYPIMSRYVVNLNDPVSVFERRQILKLAFSSPISDPNYMPVTRDLSQGKLDTIVEWLNQLENPENDPEFHKLVQEGLSKKPVSVPASNMHGKSN